MTSHTGIFLGVAAVLLAQSCAWNLASPSDMETSISTGNAMVVAFVEPQEKATTALEAQWAEAAMSSPASFIGLDCTTYVEACKAHAQPPWPRLGAFQGGNAVATYRGPRRASAISAWAARVQRPLVTTIEATSLEDFQNSDETVFIANIAPDDTEARSIFELVAANYRQEFTFGVLGGVGRENSGMHHHSTVECHRHMDDDVKVFEGSFDASSIEEFVKDSSRPIIGELLPHNHQRFIDRGWPMVYIFAVTESERAELRTSLRKVARSYYGSLTMVTVDPLDFPDLPAALGLEPGEFPAGAVHQLSSNRIYPYPRRLPISPSALQKWGLDVWQGRVQPWSPSGAFSAPAADAPGQIRSSRKVSIKSFPGMKINIGRDEL